MNTNQMEWYKAINEDKLITPGLIVYPERIKRNIESMILLSGNVQRLFPHVKTYKMQNVVKLQQEYGIQSFKCATLGEVQMLIDCSVEQLLLAIQPTKEKLLRFLELQKQHPHIVFSTLVDNTDSLALFSALSKENNLKMNLWIDINNGMNRTGIIPENAEELYWKLQNDPVINFKGFHVYDGHIRPLDLQERISLCDTDFKLVEKLVNAIEQKGGVVPEIITGGSPSFYPHALRKSTRLSPGTTLLWDLGYQKIWRESPFIHAAVLVTRLISKPNANTLCFDLGHKAVASEMPLPRVEILGLEGVIHKGQSEEHLVITCENAKQFKVGELFYAIPYHICPTVAKYQKAYTVTEGELGPMWEIEARDYQIGQYL